MLNKSEDPVAKQMMQVMTAQCITMLQLITNGNAPIGFNVLINSIAELVDQAALEGKREELIETICWAIKDRCKYKPD